MFQNEKKALVPAQILSFILDSQNDAIVVVKEKNHEVVIANDAALGLLPDFNIAELYRQYGESERSKYTVKDAKGRALGLTCLKLEWIDKSPAKLFVFDDTSAMRAEIQLLATLAYVDGLTQAPNRTKLKEDVEKLEYAIATRKKSGALAIFDLDHFKSVNDTYGHDVGDMLLQRITEQLMDDPVFNGHLYRLGGDEFALLFHENTGVHSDIREHYEKLLRGALNAYTVADLDLTCTMSMGVALFPQHGDSLSPLLHRADIALYKAKAAGRNRLAFFESEDEIAQNLIDIYINIQPILDERGKTFGYELTEGSMDDNKKGPVPHLRNFNRTLDILGFDEIDSSKKYFINYTKNMERAWKNRLKSRLILQIDIGHCGEEDLCNYRKLKELGYALALVCSDTALLTDGLLELAEYIKITPHPDLTDAVNRLKLPAKYEKIVVIGNPIDDTKELALAKQNGCALFQGNYFKEARAVTEKAKNIEPLHGNYYRLLKLTCTDEYVDFNEISDIISSDLGLSFRLLKLLNSVATEIRVPISSIPQALTYLGEEHLKKWIALLSLRGITPDKPIELISISLIRARFGENLVPFFKDHRDPDHVFMVGMLSMLHVALDKEQQEVIDEMSLAKDIRDSLLTKDGKHSDLIAFFRNYEYSLWDEVCKFAKANGLSSRVINESYLAATKWYGELTVDNSYQYRNP